MIIYFDFNLCQLKFIKQQNEDSSFAVDFLMEKADKKDFSGIIEDFCAENKEFLTNLQGEKNYVVLPDKVVGFDSLQVPTTKFGKNKYFENKFNLIYNRDGNYIAEKNVLTKNSKTTTFVFAILKKDIISQIVNTFKKYGVIVNGISYFSRVMVDYIVGENGHVAKQNVFVTIFDKTTKLIALSNGNIVASQQIFDKEKTAFSKKYASFINNKQNGLKIFEEDIEREISRTKIEKEEKKDKLLKIKLISEQFKQNLEKSNLGLKFNKECIVNSRDKFIDLDEPNVIAIENYSQDKALSKYKSNSFYTAKRSFWK